MSLSVCVSVCVCVGGSSVWKNRAVYQRNGEARGPPLSSLPTMTMATSNNSKEG